MGPTALREKKNIHRQNQIKPFGSWRYIEVLRHETIGLCKKLNSIYIAFLPLIHRTVQLSWALHTTAGAWHVFFFFFLLYCGSQTYKCITATYLSNRPLTLLIEIVYRMSMVHLRDRPAVVWIARDSWTGRRIRGKKLYKYCSVSCTDRLFRVLRPPCIITSHRV